MRRGAGTKAYIMALVCVVVAAASGCGSDPAPMHVNGGGATTGFTTDVGKLVAIGGNFIENRSDQPIEDIEVRLVSEKPVTGAHLENVVLMKVNSMSDSLGAGEWPVPGYADRAADAAGFVLSAGPGSTNMLLLIRPTQEGVWYWPSIEISYRVGDEEFVQPVTSGIYICAPRTDTCNRPSDQDAE